MFDKLEDILIRFEEIMGELNEPTVTNNQERFRKLMKEQSDLTPIVEAYKEYKKRVNTQLRAVLPNIEKTQFENIIQLC